MEVQYELGIIGAGPAGYHAALEASRREIPVVVFEQGEPGGVCLFQGCIPTKSLVSTSKEYFRLSGNAVVKAKEVLYDWEAARKKKEKDVKKLAAGLNMQLRQAGVPIVKASAKLVKADDAGVTVEADGKRYQFRDVILATGSHNVIPPVNGLREAMDAGLALDSTGILDACAPVRRLLVIGAGVAGLEIASIYANTGAEVTVLEREDRFLPGLDDSVKEEYIRSFRRKGILIKTGRQADTVAILDEGTADGRLAVRAADRESGAMEEYIADRVLVAAGRTGNTGQIGLEHVPGVQVKGGFIEVDDAHMTGCSHIYACGDVCGREQLAYTAGLAAEQIVCRFGQGVTVGKTDAWNCVPYVIFTNPEAAYIGLTEADCISRGIPYRTAGCSMNYSSLFSIENERESGAFKIICDESLHILGCHIIGNSAADLIGTIQAYMASGMTLPDVAALPMIHPSHMEIIKECIKNL